MYLIPILSIAVQAALIVHVIKTGRNMLWILAIALLPLVGSIVYVAAEFMPEALGGRTARRARSGMLRMMDPDRELRRASAEVEISGNVDARRRLAEELLERSEFDAAIDVYQGGLKGIFEHDPTLLLGLARAHFGKQDYAAARTTLERLTQHNPDFKSTEAQLLYARTSRRKTRWRRRNASTRRWRPDIPARRRVCATACCSSGAANQRRRSASSRICWTAPNSAPRIIAEPRPSGWNAPGAN